MIWVLVVYSILSSTSVSSFPVDEACRVTEQDSSRNASVAERGKRVTLTLSRAISITTDAHLLDRAATHAGRACTAVGVVAALACTAYSALTCLAHVAVALALGAGGTGAATVPWRALAVVACRAGGGAVTVAGADGTTCGGALAGDTGGAWSGAAVSRGRARSTTAMAAGTIPAGLAGDEGAVSGLEAALTAVGVACATFVAGRAVLSAATAAGARQTTAVVGTGTVATDTAFGAALGAFCALGAAACEALAVHALVACARAL